MLISKASICPATSIVAGILIALVTGLPLVKILLVAAGALATLTNA